MPTFEQDSLGQRMKSYEQQTQSYLSPRSWKIIRIDGRSFHTWTRGLEKPYSQKMVDVMGQTLLALCQEIPGTVLGYCQSDEMTVAFQDFRGKDTQPWFGGRTDKVVSVAASLATAVFGRLFPERSIATFDARVFSLPSDGEVANALLWRQQDARRNAISLLCQSHFSPRELHGKSQPERRLMLQQVGVDLNQIDGRFLHGQVAYGTTNEEYVRYLDRRTGVEKTTDHPVVRRSWNLKAAPDLTAHEGDWLPTLLSS